MEQVACYALKSFKLDGDIKTARSAPFELPRLRARELESLGLVRIIGPTERPSPAAGTPSSASPVVQVSLQTTAKESRRGDKRAKGAE